MEIASGIRSGGAAGLSTHPDCSLTLPIKGPALLLRNTRLRSVRSVDVGALAAAPPRVASTELVNSRGWSIGATVGLTASAPVRPPTCSDVPPAGSARTGRESGCDTGRAQRRRIADLGLGANSAASVRRRELAGPAMIGSAWRCWPVRDSCRWGGWSSFAGPAAGAGAEPIFVERSVAGPSRRAGSGGRPFAGSFQSTRPAPADRRLAESVATTTTGGCPLRSARLPAGRHPRTRTAGGRSRPGQLPGRLRRAATLRVAPAIVTPASAQCLGQGLCRVGRRARCGRSGDGPGGIPVITAVPRIPPRWAARPD